MAYVRTKGNQVLLVHGVRDQDSGTVEQQTLFTFYTKAEVEAAIGEHRLLFRHTLEDGHPTLRFDWNAIDAGLREHLAHVPDVAPARQNTAAIEFRNALVELTRVVWELAPGELNSAWQLIDDNHIEIGLFIEKLERLLDAKAPTDSEFSRDTPSLWRQAAKARWVPLHGWEQLDNLWDHCKYAEVEALARLLAEAFPMFADARNYLGLAAMERGDLPAALQHFLDAEAVGRKQFPKRIAKSSYWRDHSTRPFLRALIHQVSAHNRTGEFKKALDVCEKLERDYGQDITAEVLRVPVLLNDRQWQEAARLAKRLMGIYPEQHFLLTFAALELHDRPRAREHFVCGALQLPATATLLLGTRMPKGMAEDARDHNNGVTLLREIGPYRVSHGKSLQFLRQLWSHPLVQAAVERADQVRKNWRAERGTDRTWYDEMDRVKTIEHAREVVAQLDAGADAPR